MPITDQQIVEHYGARPREALMQDLASAHRRIDDLESFGILREQKIAEVFEAIRADHNRTVAAQAPYWQTDQICHCDICKKIDACLYSS